MPYQKLRPNECQVEAWWRKNPKFNIAVAMGAVSGFVALDADSKEAVELIKATCSYTPFQVITAKGRHFYFRDIGLRITNRVRIGGAHIDGRFWGSYLVGPGSEHFTGHVYRPEHELTPALLDEVPSFDPKWIQTEELRMFPVRRIEPREDSVAERIMKCRRYLSHIYSKAGSGTSDKTLLRVASAPIQIFDLGRDTALALVMEWNDSNREPPWPLKRLEYKVDQAIKLKQEGVGRQIGRTLRGGK